VGSRSEWEFCCGSIPYTSACSRYRVWMEGRTSYSLQRLCVLRKSGYQLGHALTYNFCNTHGLYQHYRPVRLVIHSDQCGKCTQNRLSRDFFSMGWRLDWIPLHRLSVCFLQPSCNYRRRCCICVFGCLFVCNYDHHYFWPYQFTPLYGYSDWINLI
jgi:hypothetical protein